MRRALPEVYESVEELESLLARTGDAQRKQRVHLLLLIRSGRVNSRLAAAKHLAAHRNSVGDWLEKYEQGGLDAMLEIGKRGARPGIRSLSPAALEALKRRLGAEGFDSYAEIQACRLMTLHAASIIDRGDQARVEIGSIKVVAASMLHNVIDRAIQVHGALGVSGDTPLERMYREARYARLYDGPDEVHRMVVARQLLSSDPASWPWS